MFSLFWGLTPAPAFWPCPAVYSDKPITVEPHTADVPSMARVRHRTPVRWWLRCNGLSSCGAKAKGWYRYGKKAALEKDRWEN